MPFGSYKTLGEAIKALQVKEVREDFVQPRPFTVTDFFRDRLARTLQECPIENSEWAVCETLIYPTLREVHLHYSEQLVIWSHEPLYRGPELLGIPDYMIAKRSPLSVKVMEPPLAMIMEAKRNDFDAGWGQCLAAMAAAQVLNGLPKRVIYGGVSDGFVWRFGKLSGETFYHHPLDFTLTRLDELFGALNHLFELCRQQVLLPVEAA